MTVSSARPACALALLALLCSSVAATAATIAVPAQYPSIQAAVDAASPGDVIRVAPGTYQESVRVRRDLPGLTIEGEDPALPPVIVGTPNKSSDGVRVERADGIVLRDLRIEGAYNGVRLNRVAGAVLERLEITDSALGIRLNNGMQNSVLGVRIVGTRVEQGIWIDGSHGAVVADTVVEETDEEGIAARNADGLVVVRTHVRSSRGSDAIRIHRSDGARLEDCSGNASQHDGIRISDSPGLVLLRCTANGNRSAGFRIEESSPIATIEDILGAGNTASGNGDVDVRVDPARCNARICTPATTTPLPTSTSTSTTVVTTVTTTVTSTTSTTLPLPGVDAGWHLYVRVATAGGGVRNADVPRGGGALAVSVPASVLAAFPVGDRVYALELPLLGDVSARFTAAADDWIRSHPTDYPDVTGVVAVLWVQQARTSDPGS
jgi:hypothetical protein